MIAYCPWCGAPIPDGLHRVAESQTTYLDHTIVCIRCGEQTYFQDGGHYSDREIVESLLVSMRDEKS